MPTAPRRRNGRPQACQPCSRRKVACDHQLPVCSRCQRARKTQQCVYLPDHRTRSVGTISARGPMSPPATVTDSHPQPTEESLTQKTKWGYLGDTNFSAVFQEASASIGELGETSDMHLATSARSALINRPLTALDILGCVPKHKASYTLFRKATLHDTWCPPAVSRILDSFWATFGSHLENGAFSAVAEKLNRGTTLAWKETESDPEEWLAAFLDEKFRWECLGALFVYWASGASAAKDDDDTEVGRKQLGEQYSLCAWNCTEIARRVHSCNTLVIWVMCRCLITESVRLGDGSMGTWRLHSDVVAFSTYMGLHVSHKSVWDKSISIQMRRRMYANVYKMDKAVAVFTGRPPLLLQKYSNTPLPLDISDQDLLSKVPAQPQKIDGEGWSTEGKVMHITCSRARTNLAMVAESILEIALQPSQFAIVPQLLALKEKAIETYNSLPSCMREMQNNAIQKPEILYRKLIVKLEHLQNLFIIERLLRRQSYPDAAQNLLRVSFEMVETALEFWGNRHLYIYIRGDMEWIITQFAAPGGGILCAELLQPHTTWDQTVVTRSDNVQKLGLLIEMLNGIDLSAPSGVMCRSIRMILTSALDKALNGEEQRGADVGAGTESWEFDFDQMINMGDDFESDFLNTFYVKDLNFSSI